MICLEESRGCSGTVRLHSTPGAANAFPRCDAHWELRMDAFDAGIEREAMSDVPPAWFDASYAGERWDDDY